MTPTVRSATAYLRRKNTEWQYDEIVDNQRILAGRARRSIPFQPVPPPPPLPDVVLLDEFRYAAEWEAIPSRIGHPPLHPVHRPVRPPF